MTGIRQTWRVPSSGGAELVVHDLGGHGDTVLFCHATGFHSMVWAPMVAHLTDTYRCIALDFRGHGDSVAPEGETFVWSHFADDVAAVVDHLNLGGGMAVGHSKGAASLLLTE